MPRHPPNALTTLNRSHCQCSSSSCTFIRTSSRPGYLLQPSLLNNAIDVFDRSAYLELRRAAHLQPVFKTSFSRLNPGSRGQATIISNPSEAHPRTCQQRTTRVTSFLPTSDPSPNSGRLGLHKDHQDRARTWDKSHTWKPPDQSSLHNVCRTGTKHKQGANLFFFKRQWSKAVGRQQPKAALSQRRPIMVELNGIEPLTPCLQSRCSPS